MHHFAYRDGVLHAEAVNLDTLATAVGTPFYCYSTATLTRHYQVFAGAFADVNALVCYAMKANSNQAVVATLAALGAGADVVSEGELMRARLAGVPADKIMFSGLGKTARELSLAVDEGILCINVESEPELDLLSSIASAKGRTVNISVRVNPDIDRQDASQDRHRQGREQVRHPDQPCARGLCAGGEIARHQGRRRRHAYRQPDHRSRSIRRCVHAAGRIRAHAARRRPHHLPCRSRRRLGHSLSRRQRAAAASGRLRQDGQARHARSRLPADLRARPADRRQCRHPGGARAVCEAWRGEEFRGGRCRHERPHPSDAL